MNRALKFVYTFLFLTLIGCSSKTKVANIPVITTSKRIKFQIPAGVDSAIAHSAKIKAEQLFVDPEKEQIADSLNHSFSEYLRITEELYNNLKDKKEDFEKIRQEFRELSATSSIKKETLGLEERRKYEKAFEQITEDSLTISIVTSLLDYYLNYCYENFQKAYDSNPFDLNGLSNLARCRWDRSEIFKDTVANRHAVLLLNKVLDHDQGVASVYKELGKNHYRLRNWEKAREYYSMAERIYVITQFFDNSQPDSTEKHKLGNIPYHVKLAGYYDYLFKKAEAEIKLYEADSAMATLETALIVAPTKNDSADVNKLVMEWIEWDGGNIYTAEQKFIIVDSLKRGNYEWAKNAYIRLLPQLSTKKAKDNITWKLARVEFKYLDQPEQAVSRLYNMVVHADTSKRPSNIIQAPDDSLYKVYFRDCGELLFGLGSKYRDEGLHDKARQYFSQDTTFEWAGRGKAFLPLAQLVQVSEDLPAYERLRIFNQESIKLLKRAKLFIKDFNTSEIDFLYRAIIQIYRQQRDSRNAELNFREWQQLKNKQSSSSTTNQSDL